MVGRLFSLTGSGFWDWVLQRVSALVILSYSIFMAAFFWTHSGLDYATWMSLCSNFWFKLGTFLTFLFIVIHAWIGLWMVVGDYIHCKFLAKTINIALILSYAAMLIFLAQLLWSI